MKKIDDLIEKYEKNVAENIESIKKEPEFKNDFNNEIIMYEMVISDLKDYKKEIYSHPITGSLEVIKTEPNYPPLRERLICSIVSGIMANPTCNPNGMAHIFQNIAQDSISQADEVIRYLKNENNGE